MVPKFLLSKRNGISNKIVTGYKGMTVSTGRFKAPTINYPPVHNGVPFQIQNDNPHGRVQPFDISLYVAQIINETFYPYYHCIAPSNAI